MTQATKEQLAIIKALPKSLTRTQRNGVLRAKVLRIWIDMAQAEGKPLGGLLASLACALEDEGKI